MVSTMLEMDSFFLVGAPKCGTTSLAKHLSRHPEVAFSDPKEPHFFSADYPFGPCGLTDLHDYRSLFPVTESTRCLGEGSVFYLYSSEAVPRIEQMSEKRARYIVCLRDPVKASFSMHAQNVAFGWEPERNYLAALNRPEQTTISANPDPKLSRALNYSNLYRYAPHIERLLNTVDRDRIFFVVMERDGHDPQEMYDRLHRFLGLAPRIVDHAERLNEARPLKSKTLYHFLTSPTVLAAASRVRRALAPNGFGLKRPIRVMGADEAKAAREAFMSDISQTARLVGFGQEIWGGRE